MTDNVFWPLQRPEDIPKNQTNWPTFAPPQWQTFTPPLTPNKLFTYLACGLCVISTQSTSSNEIVREANAGITLPDLTEEHITTAIGSLSKDPQKFSLYRKNALKAAQKINWEDESNKLDEFIKGISRR